VRIARRGIEDSTRLGRVRWVVERTMSWLLNFRRLALRYDRTEATITALLSLACALICHRRLAQPDRDRRDGALDMRLPRRGGVRHRHGVLRDGGQWSPGQPLQRPIGLLQVEVLRIERAACPFEPLVVFGM
jgi:hypothetical protein